MLSASSGFAISCGRGGIPGHVYKLQNGKWKSIYSFPYSDFPLLHSFSADKIWFVNHLAHHGAYQPIFTQLENNGAAQLALPKLMWDEFDYSMMKTIFVNPSGTAWMAAQQGGFLFYDGQKWKEYSSPIKKDTLASLLSGDINSIWMIDESTGWAVGKDGVILKYENDEWKYFPSPVSKNLNAVCMLDENYGWIVGERGIILKYENNVWRRIEIDHSFNLTALKILDDSSAYFCGENSTLLKYQNGNWLGDATIKNFEDYFTDIDIIRDAKGNDNIWLIGKDGIYTNSQTLGFSFTKITEQSGLPEDVRSGVFFKQDEKSPLNFLAIMEGAPSLLFEKTPANNFKQKSLLVDLLNPLRETANFALGDANNDGFLDLFQIKNKNNFSLLLGGKDEFSDWTSRSNLSFNEFDFPVNLAANFVDLNNDGNLDLCVSSEETHDKIFSNNGAAVFTFVKNISIKKKLQNRPNGALFSDFNNDGLIDIFQTYAVPVNKAFAELYVNKGNFKFEHKADSTFYIGSDNSIQTASAIAADFNNDTFIDIVVYNQRDRSYLLINDGDCNFTKYFISESTVAHPEQYVGVLNSADINNDGKLDLFISSKMFLNKGNLQFEEISENVGVNFLGTPIFEDVDDDGDADLFIGSSKYSLGKGERSALFRNNSVKRNFLKIFVEGSSSNRSAIGTKIILASNLNNDTLYQIREIGLGSSSATMQNISPITFGVPDGELFFVKAVFPSGKVVAIEKPLLNSVIKINESNYIDSKWSAFIRSIKRTALLIDAGNEAMRFGFIILFFALAIFFLQKIISKRILLHPFVISAIIILYLTHVHLYAHLSFVKSLLAGSLGFAVITFSFLISASYIRSKKLEKYFSHYKIISLLGEGGMGKVFKAYDSAARREVALKILHPHLLDDLENKKRFNSEGQILASLNHNNIVRVHEIGQVAEQGFISLELCEGKTLKQFIKDEFPIDAKLILNIATQLCSGLSEIHSKKIIHRDLKSNNIMIDEAGAIKIMDFGLSKSPIVTSMSSLGSVIGTLGYVSPEQITNAAVDHRSDIFSLGVIMYELTTGKIPFNGENEIALIHSIFNDEPKNPSSINAKIPDELSRMIMRALSKEKENRFASADAMLKELMELKLH